VKFVEPVEDPELDALEHHAIGVLNLSVYAGCATTA
jgi:hypothetical protein